MARTAEALLGLAADDAPRWLRETLASGVTIDEVLGAVTVAVTRSPLADGDLHARLVPGAAARLGPASELERRRLALWVVLQALPWLDPTTAPPVPSGAMPADEVDALAEAATFAVADPHPTIYAAEAAYWAERLGDDADRAVLVGAALARLDEATPLPRALVVEQVAARAAELAEVRGAPEPSSAGDRSPDSVIAVARSVLVAGEGAVDAVAEHAREATFGEVWAGLWLAAASLSGAEDGAINDVHAVTVTGALYRLSRLAVAAHTRWALALTAVARLATDAPRLDPDRVDASIAGIRFDGAPAPVDAWLARGLRPGVDVHDLKYREALLTGTAALEPGVRAAVLDVAARGGGVPDSGGLPGFDAAVTALGAR